MYQVFRYFTGVFLYNFVLAKLATSSTRVKRWDSITGLLGISVFMLFHILLLYFNTLYTSFQLITEVSFTENYLGYNQFKHFSSNSCRQLLLIFHDLPLAIHPSNNLI